MLELCGELIPRGDPVRRAVGADRRSPAAYPGDGMGDGLHG